MEHLISAIGDLTVDVILSGLSAVPEWGKETEIDSTFMRLGGNVGNMAVGASALHTDFQVIADIGKDQNGEFVFGEVSRLDLDTSHIRRLEKEETSKTYACIRPDGERFMMTSKGTLASIEETIMQPGIPKSRVLFLGGWCLPPRVCLERISERIDQWHREGRVLATDLIWSEKTWKVKELLIQFLNKIDIVFLNEKELTALTGFSNWKMSAEKIRSLLGLKERKGAVAVVKLGADGAVMITGTKEYYTEAYACKPVDTVGAGDLFNLGFLHARFQLDFADEEALKFATTFASLFIANYGSVPPSQEMVIDAMDQKRKERIG